MTNPNTAPSAAQPYAIDGVVYAIARKDQREAYVMFDTPAQANGFVEYMRRFIEKPVPAQTGGEAVAPEARADVLKQLRTAMDVVSALCDGSMRWTMSVPARPDSDPDLVISGALHAAEKLIATAPPAPPAPPAPLPGKESAFLSAVATIYIDPHDERQELEYIGHIPRGELIRLYKAPNAVHADLLNVAIAVRDACHKAWVTSAENWRADVDVKSIVSAALSSPPAQAAPEYRTGFDEAPSTFNQEDAAPADYPPHLADEVERELALMIDRCPEPLRRLSDWLANKLDEDDWKTAERMLLGAVESAADRAQRSGVSADPLPRPLLTDLEIQGLRRQARNDPRCADQHWFILMVRAIESYYGVTGAAAQSQPLVEPTPPRFAPRMDIYSRPGTPVVFDADGGYPVEKELAKKVLSLGNTYVVSKIEVGHSSTKVWLKGQGQGYNEYFNSVLFAASPQHQVKKGEPS